MIFGGIINAFANDHIVLEYAIKVRAIVIVLTANAMLPALDKLSLKVDIVLCFLDLLLFFCFILLFIALMVELDLLLLLLLFLLDLLLLLLLLL